ncbi:hypothetical protein [Nocardia sp. NPDC047038]|uniref:hypothetical protein n=1 Tax=Nocardia sp. NPDC047038 TaxID=3154338 RepID=UPI0034095EFC
MAATVLPDALARHGHYTLAGHHPGRRPTRDHPPPAAEHPSGGPPTHPDTYSLRS